MKHRGFLWSMVLVLMMTGGACQRYEDGPLVSLRSREQRVINNWKAFLISRNDLDETYKYDQLFINFKSNKDFEWIVKLSGQPETTLTGKWELASLDQQVKLSYTDPVTFEARLLYFDIIRLTEAESWMNFIRDGDLYRLRLSPR